MVDAVWLGDDYLLFDVLVMGFQSGDLQAGIRTKDHASLLPAASCFLCSRQRLERWPPSAK